MLDSVESKLGIGLGSYVVVLVVLSVVSLINAKLTGMSEHCFVIALQFSFMHILLLNILSVYYSTLASYVNITILRKYSGIGVHAQVINTRLLLSSHVAWV